MQPHRSRCLRSNRINRIGHKWRRLAGITIRHISFVSSRNSPATHLADIYNPCQLAVRRIAFMNQAEHENQIDYIELPAKDMAGTKQFYRTVFGWKFEDYGPDYTSFLDGRLAGGFTRRDTPARDLLLVIYSTDLTAIQRKIENAC